MYCDRLTRVGDVPLLRGQIATGGGRGASLASHLLNCFWVVVVLQWLRMRLLMSAVVCYDHFLWSGRLIECAELQELFLGGGGSWMVKGGSSSSEAHRDRKEGGSGM